MKKASAQNKKRLEAFRRRMVKVNHQQKMSVLTQADFRADMKQTEIIDIGIAKKMSHDQIAEVLMRYNSHYDMKKALARIKRHLEHDFDRRIAKRLNDVEVKTSA